MTVPRPGQSVHMMNWWGVLRVLLHMHRKEGRNVHELRLYTTDDLRRLYQAPDPIKLRDGSIDRLQLVAAIRWRLWWSAAGWWFLALLSFAAAAFAFLSWQFPLPPAH